MKIVKPSVTLLTPIDSEKVLRFLENCGRTCYKSESGKISSEEFVKRLIKSGHESVLEHFAVSFRIICDRGISHELVRHRLASYSQESTRYCNYGGEDIAFIKPCNIKEDTVPFVIWKQSCEQAEFAYNKLLNCNCPPQTARAVLPNSLKTEIVMTANLREWRHFLKLRYSGTTGKPHPDMKEIAEHILVVFKEKLPTVFFDIISQDKRIKERLDSYDKDWRDFVNALTNEDLERWDSLGDFIWQWCEEELCKK